MSPLSTSVSSDARKSASTIEGYFTSMPHSIGSTQPLRVAHAMMRRNRIRHLPVLEGGKLCGVLSERDLYFVETLSDVDLDRVTVREAASPDVFTVEPKTPLREVVQEMAEHRYGCAVVVDRGKVIGIFTTVDALLALNKCLTP